MGRALTRGGSWAIPPPVPAPVRGGMDSSSMGPPFLAPSGLTMLLAANPAPRSSPEPDVLRMTGVSSCSMGGLVVEALWVEAVAPAAAPPRWLVRKGRPGPDPMTSLRSSEMPLAVGVLWICCTSCNSVDCVPPAGGLTLAASGALEGLSLRDGPADSTPSPLPLLSLLSKLLAIFRLSMRPAMASGETSSPLPANEEWFAPEICSDILNLDSTEFSFIQIRIFSSTRMCWFWFGIKLRPSSNANGQTKKVLGQWAFVVCSGAFSLAEFGTDRSNLNRAVRAISNRVQGSKTNGLPWC